MLLTSSLSFDSPVTFKYKVGNYYDVVMTIHTDPFQHLHLTRYNTYANDPYQVYLNVYIKWHCKYQIGIKKEPIFVYLYLFDWAVPAVTLSIIDRA